MQSFCSVTKLQGDEDEDIHCTMLFQDNANQKNHTEKGRRQQCGAHTYTRIIPRISVVLLSYQKFYGIHTKCCRVSTIKGIQHALCIHCSRLYPLCTLNARSTYGITHVRCTAKVRRGE